MDKNYLNTIEVAKMLNVNDSTVKRWTDSGFLNCVRTPGGHRKFTISDVYKFLEKYPIADSGELIAPLKKKWSPEAEEAIIQKDFDKISTYLRYLLNAHAVEEITQFLIYLYLNKYETSVIYDKIIKQTMKIIGESWKISEIGIEDEHYFTGIIESAIQRMQAFVNKKPANGFRALCGCLRNEHHNIAVRCMANQLISDGWKAFYIGSSLPVESFLSAINTYKPNLVCISSSHITDDFAASCELIHFSTSNTGAKLMLGGQAFEGSYNISADYIADSIGAGTKYSNEFLTALKKTNPSI
jgi:excisionase family DNA binding protein